MADELAAFGLAHRLVHSSFRQAHLRGLDPCDIAVAMIARGLMLVYDLDAERALLLMQSSLAYSNDLIVRETEAIIEANNGDLESYRSNRAVIDNSDLQDPPLLDLSRRVRGIPKLADHQKPITARLNLALNASGETNPPTNVP